MDALSPGAIWAVMVIGGPIILALAVLAVYFQRSRRSRTGAPDASVRKNWGKEDVRP